MVFEEKMSKADNEEGESEDEFREKITDNYIEEGNSETSDVLDKDEEDETDLEPKAYGEVSSKSSLTKDEKIQLASQIEAAFFLAGRPLSEMELANYFRSDRITVRWAIRYLKRNLSEQNSALELIHLTKDRWVLQLCEEFSRGLYDYIEEFIPKEEMLSREEIDTLTEIAYRQPIATSMLVKILGRPTVYEHIKHLSEKGLITVEKQERSNILKTSKKFADIYGFDTKFRNLKIQLVWRLKKRAKLDKKH
ncbi:MAG: SMC-Scp complex subunit ScpB [Promethearchaeota archaeon]